MSETTNPERLGHPLRNKKKRTTLFLVIVISIGIHVVGLAAFAVIKIVQTVTQAPPEFETPIEPPVEQAPPPPPPRPTQRTTQRSMPRPQPMAVQNPLNLNMPAIEINSANMAMGLTGRGTGGGLGDIGGGMMDSLRITSFGFDRMLEGTLEGHLYDFKQTRDRKPTNLNPDGMASTVRSFVNSWNISSLSKYYKADKTLYASYFIIPYRNAAVAPEAFNAEKEIQPRMIAAIYKGKFTPQKTGRFRFYGRADDILVVRINGKKLLDASWVSDVYSNWKTSEEQGGVQFGFLFGAKGIYGDWFDLRKDLPVDVEIIIGEVPGGHFGAWLTIEEDGDPTGPKIFCTRPLSSQDKDYLLKLHPDSRKFL